MCKQYECLENFFFVQQTSLMGPSTHYVCGTTNPISYSEYDLILLETEATIYCFFFIYETEN